MLFGICATAVLAFTGRLPALSGRPELVDTVMSMLAHDPADRPAHAANWLARVRGSSLSEIPVAGQHVSRPTGSQPFPAASAGPRASSPRPGALVGRAVIPALAIAAMVLAALGLGTGLPDRNTMTAAFIGRSADSVPAAPTPEVPTSVAITVTSRVADAAPGPSITRPPASTTSSPRVGIPRPVPPTTPPPTTVAPLPRTPPAITARNESYEVEVIGQFQRFSAQDLTGFIRRRDLKAVSGEGPDGYGAANISGWRGTFGRRCLASGGSSGNLSGPGEPLHLYAYGVVGLDAAKVELVWDGGRRVEASLGNQTVAAPVRWWIATYDTADPDQIVATDAAGSSWTLGRPQLLGTFGQTGC